MRGKVLYAGIVTFFMLATIGSNSFHISSYAPDLNDLDPLVDLAIDVHIERVRKIIIDEEPSFSIKITAGGQSWESGIFTGYDVVYPCTAHFDIPDDEEEIPVSMELWKGGVEGDISNNGNKIDIYYDVKTGSWIGDDF
jgi:hypothetical protein